MDPRHLEHGHNPREIAKRLRDGPRVSYLRDWVYGGIDGTVTTFAVVAGVVGADLSTRALLILGAANLLADGFSMAAANFSGTKAEIEEYEQVRRMEERHVRVAPEGEREEIRQIFQAKGFKGEALDTVVDVITEKKGPLDRDHDDGGARPAADQPLAGQVGAHHVPRLHHLRSDSAAALRLRPSRHDPGLDPA